MQLIAVPIQAVCRAVNTHPISKFVGDAYSRQVSRSPLDFLERLPPVLSAGFTIGDFDSPYLVAMASGIIQMYEDSHEETELGPSIR